MTDEQIVALLYRRDEAALKEIDRAYGRYLHSIARNILLDAQDAEECVNDALLRAWNAIPPHRPENLATFLGKIVRNLAINRVQKQHAKKRGGEVDTILTELEECIPGGQNPEDALMGSELTETIRAFLHTLPEDKRTVFVRRYWYAEPIRRIAAESRRSPAAVTMLLQRMRRDLMEYLQKRRWMQ